MAIKARPAEGTLDDPEFAALLPTAVDGGTQSVESLGRWVDDLMGDARIRRAVDRELTPMTMRDDEMPEDPEPVEPPPAVQGGTETMTKGDETPGETPRAAEATPAVAGHPPRP